MMLHNNIVLFDFLH